MRIMTYNIKCDWSPEIDHNWDERREMVASVVRFHSPDVACLQEAFVQQVEYLAQALPEYG